VSPWVEGTSTTQMKTVDPTWQEVFQFRTPPGKELLDEEAGLGLDVNPKP